MQHYWGAKAILSRAGYSPLSYRKFPEYVERHQIPCYLMKHGRRRRPVYHASEAMFIAWELSKAKQLYEDLKANRMNNKDRRYRCLDRERQSVAA